MHQKSRTVKPQAFKGGKETEKYKKNVTCIHTTFGTLIRNFSSKFLNRRCQQENTIYSYYKINYNKTIFKEN